MAGEVNINKVDALLELERRGELPPQAAAMLNELRNRGALPAGSATPPTARQLADKTLGIDPTLKDRGTILPLAREPGLDPNRTPELSDLTAMSPGGELPPDTRGDIVFAWPEAVRSAMETVARPKALLEGAGFTPGDALQDAMNLAGMGGTFSKAGPAAAMTRSEATMANRTMPVPSTAAIKESSQKGFKAVEDSNIAFTQDAYKGLLLDIAGWAEKTKTNKGSHPGVVSALEQMAKGFFKKTTGKDGVAKYKDVSASGGKDMTLQDIMALRKLLADQSDELNTVGKPTAQAQRAQSLVDRVDRFVDEAGTEALSIGSGADKAAALTTLRQARTKWAGYMKATEIERILEKAELTRGGYEAGLRNGISALLKSDKRSKWYTKAEKEQLRRALHGSTLTRLKRVLARTAVGGEGSSIIGGSIGAGIGYGVAEMLGLPGAVGAVSVPVAGNLARGSARRATTKETLRAQAIAAQGAKYPNVGGNAAEALRLLKEIRNRGTAPAVGTTVLPPAPGLPRNTRYEKWA